MATIKSYTDIEQSKKLAEILPPESADMFHFIHEVDTVGIGYKKDAQEFYSKTEFEYIPCWSLAALLEQLYYEVCDDEGYSSYLQINKDDDMYQLEYTDPSGIFESIETDRHEHFVDTCYEMILKLKELNLL